MGFFELEIVKNKKKKKREEKKSQEIGTGLS